MKRTLSVFVMLALICCNITAYASEASPPETSSETVVLAVGEDNAHAEENQSKAILKDVRVVNDNQQNLIIKTWDIPPNYNPDNLVEAEFEKNGYSYRKSYLLLATENNDRQTNLASQTVTISHNQKDEAVSKLSPLIDYDLDDFKGQLKLDTTSVFTEAAQKESYAYTVQDTREYTGLERNDTYNIPKTVTKNGATLSLVNVEWTALGQGGYRALAYYEGQATGVNVSAYRSTATYIGEVTKDVLESITYAVVYEGSKIPLPGPNYLLYTLIGVFVVLLMIAATILWRNRRNIKIYALIDGQYRVVHKLRVSYIDPIIDLTAPSLGGISRDYLVVVDRFAAKRLNNQFIRVICADGTVKEHRMVNNGYGCKLRVGSYSALDEEES